MLAAHQKPRNVVKVRSVLDNDHSRKIRRPGTTCLPGMLGLICLLTMPLFSHAASVRSEAQIEADWLTQARLRYVQSAGPDDARQRAADAAGGCDGTVDGKWGFHTALEDNPWWQVDLGQAHNVRQLVLYNRCDGFSDRANRLRILLSEDGRNFQQYYEHNGSVFYGFADSKPLVVNLPDVSARFVRLMLPGHSYFHLDEVQIFGADKDRNLALHQKAIQSSTSQWSTPADAAGAWLGWRHVVQRTVERGLLLADRLASMGVDTRAAEARLRRIADDASALAGTTSGEQWQSHYFAARRIVRQLALSNPLLDFQDLLFVKRVPSMFPHLSDQYYGWWARPGGGLYILRRWKSTDPQLDCLTEDWQPGNFLRPDLSHDGERVVFAYSRFFPHVADLPDKRTKSNLPEEVFYHLFEMDLATGDRRVLTRGRYDDFDARYLPDGDIIFLSTRKGQFLQTSEENTRQTLTADLPDSYVRCGGDDHRPVPVFTLHRMAGDGSRLRPISAFETFEYTPSIANDGRILYCRWDYIDRFNGHFFSLWSTNADGTNAQLVYGNFTKRPQATMEPHAIPGSTKILFTAAAHHSITGGSLVLLDTSRGLEGDEPIERVTPEVPFPETEQNVGMYYANPWPLSEDFYLVSWSDRKLPAHRRMEDEQENPSNAQGIYLADRFGNLELLYRDPQISSMTPVPLRPRPKPPAYSGQTSLTDQQTIEMGGFAIQDVYHGMPQVPRGTVARLRVLGAVPKVQPQMNVPPLGVSREETGKFILGTVPIEPDGSVHFSVPAGLPVFFQAIDHDGFAVQTMRSLTYVQPGQTLSCIGCHEPRTMAPPSRTALAMRREPSPIETEMSGTWPLRFDVLVQPVLDQHCVECHRPAGDSPAAARFDLTPAAAWSSLIEYADGNLKDLVFERDASLPGFSPARESQLLKYLRTNPAHCELGLAAGDWQRLITWMDTYGQTQGAFSEQQERQLEQFRQQLNGRILSENKQR